ncbi:hypothetical protein BASA50_005747 [Batrachochytrium salamandrivorans]|uniref:Uncharacterized protein n=1 Tax=Batrachochytrium salamandrivorans TaxID=1357716 RepID=A0ABQ8FBV7_9FUNG|nr:hypothetical protein BASA60_000434 [Batrachochytrium salamandrivorans]KAH6595538.1 hypothetical protein BASA50_005747 [Batrachochytrium salamandrivorans]
MQFFHLVSFVVVASYAAALPQPAELSEKYLNNVNVNLASGLEARSYQPAFNSQKGSATLVSLKRRDDSDGSSGENSGSDSPPSPPPSPPPATTREKKFSSPFTEETVNSMALASTINNVGDGIAGFYEKGDKAGQKIGGNAGNLLTKYLRRASYVNAAVRNWVTNFVPDIRDAIKDGLGDAEYSEVGPDSIETSDKLTVMYRTSLTALLGATSNIVDDLGSVTENLQTINRSFENTVYIRVSFIWGLKSLLDTFTAGETLSGYLADISKSIDDFAAEQNELFAKIVEEYEAASSQ